MSDKDTNQLENELTKTDELEDFLDENKENFFKLSLSDYLEQLLAEKNLSKLEVVKKSLLNPTYAYHIFAGRKKNPSRDKVICLSLAMELTLQETQRLLYFSGNEKLYVKTSWDSIVMFALEKNFSVERTNKLLHKFAERPLLGDIS